MKEKLHLVNMTWTKRSSIVAVIGLGICISTFNVNAQTLNRTAQIPTIEDMGQIITFIQEEEVTDTYELRVNIPQINNTVDHNDKKVINKAIDDKIQVLIEQAKKEAEAYKKAYIGTGGTEETFAPVCIDIDYSIKYNRGGTLSFIINYVQSGISGYNKQYFYNLDLVNNKKIALEDLFGEGYETAINESINKQIKERSKDDKEMFFENFEGIKEDHNFYINEYGEVVVVFGKYEIAPGTMGIQEFVIKDVPMKIKYPEQVGYTVEKRQLENNKNVNYPVIVGYKGELLMNYMNQSLYKVVEKYNQEGYSNLMLDYDITRMDDTVLSVVFNGGVELDGIGTVPIKESINLDTAKTGQELTIENYIKQDVHSQAKWKKLMNQQVKEKGLKDFEEEGVKMYFKDSRVTFYYMPLDDMAKQFVFITLPLEELETIVNEGLEHIYYS